MLSDAFASADNTELERARLSQSVRERIMADGGKFIIQEGVGLAVKSIECANGLVSIAFAVGESAHNNQMYINQVMSGPSSDEILNNAYSRYMGIACTYSIIRNPNFEKDGAESAIITKGNGEQSNEIAFVSRYSPNVVRASNEMANGSGLIACDSGYNFDQELKDALAGDNEDVTDISYCIEHKDDLMKMFYGGFNVVEYIEENGEAEFIKLCKTYNEVSAGADFDMYYQQMIWGQG